MDMSGFPGPSLPENINPNAGVGQYFHPGYPQPSPQPGSSSQPLLEPLSQQVTAPISRSKLPPRLLTNDAEIEPHELDYKTEWKSAALDDDLVKARDRMDLHQCLQEKCVDLLLQVQEERGNDPPGSMFHAMAFPIGENWYQCGKKGCPYKGTAEHMRQHLHKKDHLGIPFFPCSHCSSKFCRKADLTRHEKACTGVRQSMATAPMAVHNLDDPVAARVRKNLKNGLPPVPYPQPDSRKKHSGVHAKQTSWDIPPPHDLSLPLALYPQQNTYFSGMNRQEPPLGLGTSTWPNHSAGLSCPPPDVNDLSIPYSGQPNFSTQGSTYHPHPFPPNRTNNMPASNILGSPLAYTNNGTPSAPSGSPPDYTNNLFGLTSAPVFRNDIGMWPRVLPQSTAVTAETTDMVYKEKRDASEAESGTKVGPNKIRDYSGVCCIGGRPSGTACLVVLTAFFVALVLLVLGISFAFHLRPLDIQRWQPLLLGLLD